MSFETFETALGKFSLSGQPDTKVVPKTVKYGMKYNVDLSFESIGTMKGRRENAYFSNVASLLGKINFEYGPDLNVYDGINATCISPTDGRPDPDLMAKLFTTSWANDGRATTNKVNSVLRHSNENSVFVLYNLMRLYYIKLIQEHSPDMTVNPDDIFYADGHIQVCMRDALGISESWKVDEIQWHDPVPMIQGVIDSYKEWGSGPDARGNGEHEFAVDVKDLNTLSVFIIRTACNAFNFNSPIKFMHNSGIAVRQVTTFGSNPFFRHNESFHAGDFDSVKVYDTITKFIVGHRLHTQFDMAYAIMAQTMYMHIPRSAESLIWYKKAPTLVMPYSNQMRGCTPELLAGTPFVTDPIRWSTFASWARAPSRIIYHSIALSEAVLCSTFDYATRERPSPLSMDFADYPDPLNMYVGDVHIKMCGIVRDMKLLAMRLGDGVKAPWASPIGLVRYQWFYEHLDAQATFVDVIDNDAISAYNIVTRTVNGVVRTILPLAVLMPCCYPLLTMGVNISKYYMNDLEYDVSVQYNESTKTYDTTDIHEAHKFAMIMRIAGWDCTIRRMSDGKLFTNWAANHNGHYLPTFMSVKGVYERYQIIPGSFSKRQFNWIELPSLMDVIVLKVRLNYQTTAQYYDGVDMFATMQRIIVRKVDPNTFRVREADMAVSYVQMGIDASRGVDRYQDFLVADTIGTGVAIAALAPVVTTTTGIIAHAADPTA